MRLLVERISLYGFDGKMDRVCFDHRDLETLRQLRSWVGVGGDCGWDGDHEPGGDKGCNGRMR